jgi:hypothetical protein
MEYTAKEPAAVGGWKVVVCSNSRELFSAFTLDVFILNSHEEAVAFIQDRDCSLRRAYAWGTASFVTASILAFEVTPQGHCEYGLRHFCLSDEEIAKECAERSLSFEKALESRAEARSKPQYPFSFIAKFTN